MGMAHDTSWEMRNSVAAGLPGMTGRLPARVLIQVLRVMLLSVVLAIATSTPGWAQGAAPQPNSSQHSATQIFARDTLVAWCIVPFDAARRGPQERAAMVSRLGLKRVAYDWRDEHVPTFEEEILAYRQHGIDYFAFWSEHPRAFELFKAHNMHPQVWMTNPSPAGTREQAVLAAAFELQPAAQRVLEWGGQLGLYNHGGWGGQPENLVAVCLALRNATQSDRIGIVYNFHHAHERMDTFAADLRLMQPYLLCVNINGMNDHAQPKILPVGQGRHDRAMLTTLLESGYQGPVGIINHREEIDAEVGLRENIAGLEDFVKAYTTKSAETLKPSSP